MSPQLPSKKQNRPVVTPRQQRREARTIKRLSRMGGYGSASRMQLARMVYREPDEVVTRLVCEAIEAGSTPAHACELVGIDARLLDEWLKRATGTKDPRYQDFRRHYTKAIAQRKKQQQSVVPLIQGFDVALLCTPERLQEIYTFIEKGVFPAIAIESTGIPATVFYAILADGQQDPTSPYRHIYLSFITMQAKARAGAEMRVYDDAPLAWLMNGPGRERPGSPGWTRQSAITGQDGGAVQVVTTHWGGATTTASHAPMRVDVVDS